MEMYNLLQFVLLLKLMMILFVLGLLNVEISNLHVIISLQVDQVFVLLLKQLQDLVFVFGRIVSVQRQNVKIYHYLLVLRLIVLHILQHVLLVELEMVVQLKEHVLLIKKKKYVQMQNLQIQWVVVLGMKV